MYTLGLVRSYPFAPPYVAVSRGVDIMVPRGCRCEYRGCGRRTGSAVWNNVRPSGGACVSALTSRQWPRGILIGLDVALQCRQCGGPGGGGRGGSPVLEEDALNKLSFTLKTNYRSGCNRLGGRLERDLLGAVHVRRRGGPHCGHPAPRRYGVSTWPTVRAVALLRVGPTQSSETGTVQGLHWHNLPRERKG